MAAKVLIIDDDPVVLLLHKVILKEDCGADMLACFSEPVKALEHIITHQEEIDKFVILLDINMPVMSGWDLMDALYKELDQSQLHVIIVSSSVSLEDKEKAKTYPSIMDYWEKPISKNNCISLKQILESLNAC